MMTSQTYNHSLGTYRRLTIKGLVVLLAAIIVFTLINLKDIGQAQEKLDQMVNDIAVKLATAESMVEMIKTVDIYTRNIILITDVRVMREELTKLLGARSIYDAAEARLARVFISEEDKGQIKKIKELRVKARPMVDHAISLGLKNMDKEAISYLLHEVVPANEQRLAALNELIKWQQNLSKKIAADIGRTHARARILICALGLVALALGISTFVFLPRKVRAYYEGPTLDEVTPRIW